MKTIDIAKQFNLSRHVVGKFLRKNNLNHLIEGKYNKRNYPINEDFFDNIDTQEKAYLLGLLYADGYNYKKYFRLDLHKKDIDILYKIQKLIFLDDKNHITPYKDRDTAYLNVYSTHISKTLTNIGCTNNKSLTITFPIIQKDLQRHFIRGYYDGDGGLSFNDNYTSCSIISTKEFLDSMLYIINKEFETKHYIQHTIPDKNVHRLYFSNKNITKQFLDWIYKDASIYLDRKYNKYLALLEAKF